jgi:glycosyltransferase involved in cell wall biosynthesis
MRTAPSKRTRALVVHAGFDPLGGAEVYAVRVIKILQDIFDDVCVVHIGKQPAIADVAAFTGIRLDPARVTFKSAPMPRVIAARSGMTLLKYAFAVRYADRMSEDFDIVIGTFAECPVRHRNVIQTIHVPMFVWDQESLVYCGFDGPPRRRLVQRVYINICRAFLGLTRAAGSRPLSLANSEWTAAQFRRHYPCSNVQTIYFGVETGLKPGSAGWTPFSAREDGVVLIGRIVPEKRVEDAIAVIREMRRRGHALNLHIIGKAAANTDQSLLQKIRDTPWISWRDDLSRSELEALAATQKWGLHCCPNEHYGFAPAELQALGCITFVPDSGGQREIIVNPNQRYSDVRDAVEKFEAVLRATETHAQLVEAGLAASTLHTTSGFEAELTELIRQRTHRSFGRASEG